MCAGRTICPILLNTPTRCSKDDTKIVFGDGGTPEHHAQMKKVSIGTPEHHARMKKGTYLSVTLLPQHFRAANEQTR